MTNFFDHLSDDLDAVPLAPGEAPANPCEMYREKCAKCSGSGKFRVYTSRFDATRFENRGDCFACKGRGFNEYRQSAGERAAARQQTVARKARSEQAALDAFALAHPQVAAWIAARREGFEFAQSMHEAIGRFGSLAERQLAACERLVAQDAQRAVERAQAATSAPAVETDRLMAAFDAAKASGLKRPKMRFEGFQASLAPAEGKNAGAVYLKTGETYLGKIAGGKFLASRDCDAPTRASIVATMADPLAAAVAYGRREGSCSCCGRTLTDPESVSRGIGPICADNFGL